MRSISPIPASPRPLRRHRLALAAMLVLCLAVVGCDDDEGGPSSDTSADGTDPDGTASGDGSGDGSGDAAGCVPNPGGDADGDGIPNGFEDTNLNCIADAGETDWQNADSDGDGLSDGEEDINLNGQVDGDEFDPRKKDTDDNGIEDADEPLAQVCLRELITPIFTGPAPSTRTLLGAASTDFVVSPRAERVATFSLDDAVFGYVVLRDSNASDVREPNGQALFDLASAGFSVLVELQEQPFDTWSLVGLPARRAIRTRVTLGEQSGGLASLASELGEALHGAPLNALEDTSDAVCLDDVVLWQTTTQRNDGTAVIVGALTCRSNMASAAGFAVDDLTNTTMFSPATADRSFKPSEGACEVQEADAEPADADFLWVIDNSGSMSDEQEAVANAADLFFETLTASGTEWRLGVTTTETWGFDQPECTPDARFTQHTPSYDMATGLRGEGFVTPSTPGALDVFKALVTTDAQCMRDPAGSNICGSGFESGLESGLTVLDRSAADERPAFALREDAITAVIWLSDEEDQRFKDKQGFEPWPADSPLRAGPLQDLVEAYAERNVFACAIVGDRGLDAGGVCPLLDPAVSTQLGAQPGQGYVEVAEGTGGVSASICNAELDATIDACVRSVFQFQNRYPLRGQPLSASLRVVVDGTVIERSATSGWSYDAAGNAVVLFGVPLGSGSSIAVSYREWEPIGG